MFDDLHDGLSAFATFSMCVCIYRVRVLNVPYMRTWEERRDRGCLCILLVIEHILHICVF